MDLEQLGFGVYGGKHFDLDLEVMRWRRRNIIAAGLAFLLTSVLCYTLPSDTTMPYQSSELNSSSPQFEESFPKPREIYALPNGVDF